MIGDGRAPRPAPRAALIALLVVVVGGLAFGAGVLVGSADEDPGPAPGPTPTAAPAEPVESPTPSPQPTAEPAVDLPDGRYFVSPVEVTDDAPRHLVFDLAYFLTGSEATQAAIDHGVEVPLPNDSFIVNDNTLLRQVPVSPGVIVRYIPATTGTSQLQPGLFDPWAAAVNGELQTDYAGGEGWWWITIRAGQVERIEQQFLP